MSREHRYEDRLSILITGISGSGKSTICAELLRRGCSAFDFEDIPGMTSFINRATGEPAHDWGGDNPEWFEENRWTCDKAKLESLVDSRSGVTFFCGLVSNLDDLLPLFDKVFLLSVSPENIRKRLRERQTNDFGRGPAVQKWVLGWKSSWEDEMQQKGAILIDANENLEKVVQRIITWSRKPG